MRTHLAPFSDSGVGLTKPQVEVGDVVSGDLDSGRWSRVLGLDR